MFLGLGFAACLWLATAVAQDQPTPKDAKTPDVFEQNKKLGRGVNVLGYDPLWKNSTKQYARFKAEFFQLIHEAGFNHVRLNIHPFRDSEPAGTINDYYWKTLDWAVEQATKNGVAIIIDFHEFIDMAKNPEAKKDRFLATWKQIAERYKDAPRSVYFEILNEPNGDMTPELWNQYLKEALAIIRKSNPDRTVIVGPAFWNSIDCLGKLKLPADDRNLIVTVHYYLPMEFTHQGAPWAHLEGKTGVAWGTEKDRQMLQHNFERVAAWAKSQNRPIYLGEFGVYDKADMKYRVKYLAAVREQAEQYGWSWAYWQFDSDFLLYFIPKHQWNKPVVDALIPASR